MRLFTLGAYARRRSIDSGLLGDSTFWRFAFFVIFGRRLVKRFSRAELVAVEKLAPGQFVRIEAIDPRTLPPAERKRAGR